MEEMRMYTSVVPLGDTLTIVNQIQKQEAHIRLKSSANWNEVERLVTCEGRVHSFIYKVHVLTYERRIAYKRLVVDCLLSLLANRTNFRN